MQTSFFFGYNCISSVLAAYINSINTFFDSDQNQPQSIPQPVFLPEPTYNFLPNSYPNLYAVTEPYQSSYAFYNVHNPQNTDDKSHKWWSFHNLKEKFKSFFKHKFKQNDETQNSANLFPNQQQFQGKNEWKTKTSTIQMAKISLLNFNENNTILTGYDTGYDYGMTYDSGGSSKEMTLKKVYELALTAIAFLSFGIFVLQVIMCITTVGS